VRESSSENLKIFARRSRCEIEKRRSAWLAWPQLVVWARETRRQVIREAFEVARNSYELREPGAGVTVVSQSLTSSRFVFARKRAVGSAGFASFTVGAHDSTTFGSAQKSEPHSCR